jgi:hypothetical protein
MSSRPVALQVARNAETIASGASGIEFHLRRFELPVEIPWTSSDYKEEVQLRVIDAREVEAGVKWI